MSTLIAVTYPNAEAAKSARETLSRLQRQELVNVNDAVIAEHMGNRIDLDQSISLAGVGALGGAVWGGLLGLIFLVPVLGAAVGAATGAIGGALSDYGIDDEFAKQLGSQLNPGQAALVLLVRSGAPDRVTEEMKKSGHTGEILYTNLSTEDEQRLRDAVATA